MSATLLFLPACNYRRERWRNQQGWTREILRQPDSEDFDWRASIAEISHDTLFSPYPGMHRTQVLLQGTSVQLGFVDGRRLHLKAPCQQIEFDGTEIVACHLPDGPAQVFNLIWNPDRIQLQLLRRPIVGSMVFLHEPGVEWFVHLLAGRAQASNVEKQLLDPGDSALLRAAPGERLLLEGGGEILLARLARPDEANAS